MIIKIVRPFANDHPDQPGLLQMNIWMDGPLPNDHPDGPASCKLSTTDHGPLVKPRQLNFFFLLLETKILTNENGEEFVGQHQRKPSYLSSPEEGEDMQTTPSKQSL